MKYTIEEIGKQIEWLKNEIKIFKLINEVFEKEEPLFVKEFSSLIECLEEFKKSKEQLDYIARNYWNAIRYCCGTDKDEWQTDFFGTLDRVMEKEKTFLKNERANDQ